MPWWLDLATYGATFLAGVAGGRALTVRSLSVTQLDGHPVIEIRHADERD